MRCADEGFDLVRITVVGASPRLEPVDPPPPLRLRSLRSLHLHLRRHLHLHLPRHLHLHLRRHRRHRRLRLQA